MENSTPKYKNGFAPVLIIVVVLVLVGVVGYVLFTSTSDEDSSLEGTLPPVSERVNPEPLGSNSIFVDEVVPGSSVLISKVELESDGYIVVSEENANGERASIGRSDLLSAGTHTNVSISTSSTSDGDVVYITLETASGEQVVDDNENLIEVQKNVGMVMTHYDNEY